MSDLIESYEQRRKKHEERKRAFKESGIGVRALHCLCAIDGEIGLGIDGDVGNIEEIKRKLRLKIDSGFLLSDLTGVGGHTAKEIMSWLNMGIPARVYSDRKIAECIAILTNCGYIISRKDKEKAQ